MKARIKCTGVNLAKSVKDDIKAQFMRLLDIYNRDAALQVLWILHFEFGFGMKRLQRFANLLVKMQEEQRKDTSLTMKIHLGYAQSN